MTPERLRSRALACELAAEQLMLNWTDDPMAREEGDRLTRLLQAECAKFRAIANAREFNDPRLLPL